MGYEAARTLQPAASLPLNELIIWRNTAWWQCCQALGGTIGPARKGRVGTDTESRRYKEAA